MKLRSPSPNYDKVAIVFGATGQIGSYLCEYLLTQGYGKVIGVCRRTSNNNNERLLLALEDSNFILAKADITDSFSLNVVLGKHINDKDLNYEIYNLAAQSQVHVSFEQPNLTMEVTGVGHLNLLNIALNYHNIGYKIRTYFMASSEMYGKNRDLTGFQSATTNMEPCSPYGAAKLYAYNINKIYRESYKMWNCTGIIFNTESPRRGEEFVTRKISKWFAQLGANNFSFSQKLQLGNIESCRDWTHALDTVRAIHLIMTAPRPKDYIVASGETHTVFNFMTKCYQKIQEITGQCFDMQLSELYECSSHLLRPSEVPYLKGKANIIFEELGWKPKITFDELVEQMVLTDYKNLVNGEVCV